MYCQYYYVHLNKAPKRGDASNILKHCLPLTDQNKTNGTKQKMKIIIINKILLQDRFKPTAFYKSAQHLSHPLPVHYVTYVRTASGISQNFPPDLSGCQSTIFRGPYVGPGIKKSRHRLRVKR